MAGPSVTLTRVGTQEINSVLTAWGTDGAKLYPLFQTASSGITKTVRSKLWDKPSYIMQKHAERLYVILQNNNANPASLTVSIDDEAGTAQTISFAPNVLTWTNSLGATISWVNNTSASMTWALPGVPVGYTALDASGVLLGLTMSSTAPDFSIVSTTMVYQQYTLNM